MSTELVTRPVAPGDVADLARLFESRRNTGHCWCMSFCVPRHQFAVGWLTGGNRRRFEAMAMTSPAPMGVLASRSGQPVGWCACGPRSRYAAATRPGHPVLGDRAPEEDGTVWLLPCFVVAPEHRGQGVARALVRAAVEVARDAGAVAVEGWPLAASAHRPADAFLGREQVFADTGFRSLSRPTADRVLMRLDLRHPG